MFAIRFLITVAHSIATGMIWYEYLRMVQIGRDYQPPVLLVTHYHSPSLGVPVFAAGSAVLMWALLILRASRRDREEEDAHR